MNYSSEQNGNLFLSCSRGESVVNLEPSLVATGNEADCWDDASLPLGSFTERTKGGCAVLSNSKWPPISKVSDYFS